MKTYRLTVIILALIFSSIGFIIIGRIEKLIKKKYYECIPFWRSLLLWCSVICAILTGMQISNFILIYVIKP